ncbi:DUF4149 domain-containing membrane protein [Campylobacter mucosalis]|nr:DUF4149 domain-containing membrane protein [Campylobacter mucosalis]
MAIKNIYLFFLAGLVGMEIALGVFVAPAIFYPQRFGLEGVLTHFQSGIIMTQIFIKYNYFLLFVSLFAILFELINLRKDECKHVKISSLALAFINLALALIFIFYFTDFILQAQAKGEVATIANAEFNAIHKASEYVMKLMMAAQTLLFFLKSFKR